MSARRATAIVSIALALSCAGSAGAATFCVETASELQFALSVAAVNGEDDEIRIVAGHYPAPPDGFLYDAGVASGDSKALSLSGGWAKAFGICVSGSQDAAATVLDGGNATRVMQLTLRGLGDVSLRRLSFVAGNALGQGQGDGGGLRLVPGNGYAGRILVENNRFAGSTGVNGGGLSLRLTGSGAVGAGASYRLFGNAFSGNRATAFCGAAQLMTHAGSHPVQAEVAIVGNSVVANASEDPDEPIGGLCLLSDVADRTLASNLVWGNQGVDLALFLGGHRLLHNNIGVVHAPYPASLDEGNLSLAPLYLPCQGVHCQIPSSASPLREAGLAPIPDLDGWPPARDLRGQLRVLGAGIDIGAYESEPDALFDDGFED
jgi:hypothetical protein